MRGPVALLRHPPSETALASPPHLKRSSYHSRLAVVLAVVLAAVLIVVLVVVLERKES